MRLTAELALRTGDRSDSVHAMLFAPGRICTSSPELSFGSHIFQDLVEAEIFYTAVFANERTKVWRPEKIRTFPDVTGNFLPDLPDDLRNVITVYDVSEKACTLWYDMDTGRGLSLWLRNQTKKITVFYSFSIKRSDI